MAQSVQPSTPLETEPIGRLIRRYSVPTALTLMVSYLYNIVDQIFVGQGVGVTGMAATNVAFPLSIVTVALALFLGDGCAANMSLCLGRREQEQADRTISCAVTLLVAAGVLLLAVVALFAPQIVVLFGSTQTAYADALAYTRIIALGLPFQLFCTSFASIIRADGNPQYPMKCMMLGAGINLVLDPIFIFGLHQGVVGAAIATVLGQAAGGILCLAYIPRFQSVHVRRGWMRPQGALCGQILKLGFPSFLTQIMTAAVQVVMNNLMTRYGAQTVYGGDVALSVYGMVMKVYQIAHAMFVGVSSATQPINGYNFGARHYDRVRATYRMAAGIALLVSVGWFAVYELFPGVIGALFVANDPLYLDACRHIFRLYMLGFFVYGLHMATASFFQGIGRPGKSLAIPLVRQGVVLIPLALILSQIVGFNGALLAAPIADVVSFLLSLFLVRREFRQWRAQGWLVPEN